MSLINLKNIVTLGVLDDGIYPSVRDATGSAIADSLDFETAPILYLYHRKNGHLYLYRSTEEIEIDLTNVTAYDNILLYKLTANDNIEESNIDEFQSANFDSNICNFNVAWNKPNDGYIFILVPLVLSISSIIVQNTVRTNDFMLVGTYSHKDKVYSVYRNKVWIKDYLSFDNNENINIKVFVRELTAEELNPINQLVLQLSEHVNNIYNPHNVTKDQLNLENVDNTRDIDKPVSNAQRNAIESAKTHADALKTETDNTIQNLIDNIDNQFNNIVKILSEKVNNTSYSETVRTLNSHILNKKNPHAVDKTQVGLSEVDNTSDADKPVSLLQKQYIDATKGTIRAWFDQLNVWITNHTKAVNELFGNVWKAINTKLSKDEYANDRCNIKRHIDNFENPHKVTAEQVGLGTAKDDINELQHNIVEIHDNLTNKQDISSEELTTIDKTIIGAINEVNGEIDRTKNHLISDSIKRIELTSKIPETSFDSILWVRIPKNNEDYINVDVTATPENAQIDLYNSEGEFAQGIGKASVKALVNTRLHVIVTADNYIHQDKYIQLDYDDADININLAKQELYKLNITASPENAKIIVYGSDITYTHPPYNDVFVEGVGSVNYESYYKYKLKIVIQADDYITQTHYLTWTNTLSKAYILEKSLIPQGYVNLSAIDLTTSISIGAYIHDKDSDDILGQIIENRVTRIAGELNTTKNLIIVSSGYINKELTVTFTDPATDITVDLEPEPAVIYNKPFRILDVNGNQADYSHLDFKVFNNATGNWDKLESSDNTYFYIEGEEDEEFNIKIESDIYLPVYLVVQLNNNDVYNITIEQVPPIPDDLVMFKVNFYVSENVLSENKFSPYNIVDLNRLNKLNYTDLWNEPQTAYAAVAPKWVKTSVIASDYTKRVHTIKDNVLSIYAHDGESLLIEVEFEGYDKIVETIIADVNNKEFRLTRPLFKIIFKIIHNNKDYSPSSLSLSAGFNVGIDSMRHDGILFEYVKQYPYSSVASRLIKRSAVCYGELNTVSITDGYGDSLPDNINIPIIPDLDLGINLNCKLSDGNESLRIIDPYWNMKNNLRVEYQPIVSICDKIGGDCTNVNNGKYACCTEQDISDGLSNGTNEFSRKGSPVMNLDQLSLTDGSLDPDRYNGKGACYPNGLPIHVGVDIPCWYNHGAQWRYTLLGAVASNWYLRLTGIGFMKIDDNIDHTFNFIDDLPVDVENVYMQHPSFLIYKP